MEVRRSKQRHNTTSVVAPRSISKKHLTAKSSLVKAKKEETTEQIEHKNIYDISSHEASKFIRGTNPTKVEFKKFVTLFYRGLYYSINNLKGPS
jgi:6-pyruvoyl-tetrahydropterin synthase